MPRLCKYLLLLCALIAGLVGRSAAQEALPENDPKYATARKVFDNLVQAVGDGRTPPRLRLVPRGVESRQQVVWYHPIQNTISLQEQVYDLCVALGPDSLDALAFLLGHELAHHYRDHNWGADFGLSLADLEVGKTLSRLNLDPDRIVQMEIEADYFGGFFGCVAGYHPFGVMPVVLERIYTAYDLREELPGYPSLPERQQIARRALAQLEGMVPIFNAGHQLLLIKRYEEAGRCFDHVARTFPSRELLNNAGLARVLEVLEQSQEETARRLAYPFELDAATRLRGSTKGARPGSMEADPEYRQRRLREAGEWFEKARARDPDYAAAYINLAGVADLQGEYEGAVYLTEKAMKIARTTQDSVALAHALILRGIARIHRDPQDQRGAAQDFAQAQVGSPALARLNLAAITLSPEEDTVSGGVDASTGNEQIGDRSPLDFPAIMQDPAVFVAEVPAVDRHEPAIDIYARQAATWNALVVETGYRILSFLETRPEYEGRTERGIQIGHDLLQVRAAYGLPNYLLSDRRCLYHVYESFHIVFQTDAGEVVQGWMLYTPP